jgi:GT2 family glycosyltransferase
LKLSVIIVNYNVKYFLEQTIRSVSNACRHIEAEVLVVDNHSADDSVQMVKEKFPQVLLIENKNNPGFSKANNQAIARATGEYILLLNPDTVVAEDTFERCIQKMDQDLTIGALGVKMIDGRGDFLPESKRSLPSPKVAFYKISGLSSLFPTSKEFAKYHVGDIPSDQSAYIEILSGAFMFMRKKVLEKIGYLDETFFMYGEDIDLSYRFILEGYKNFYLADTTIIHYKGESTKKGSINYVKAFYEAMIIFADKHFKNGSAKTFAFLMETAIWMKAGMALLTNLFRKFNFVLLDFLGSMLAIELIKTQWAVNIKHQPTYYPPIFSFVIVPLYILIWLSTIYVNGGYDKPVKAYKIIRGTFWGTIFIAAFYAFLPEHYRYSRAIILFGAFATALVMLFLRVIINYFQYRKFQVDEQEQNKVVIVGSKEESQRVLAILEQTGIDIDYVGRIGPKEDDVLLGPYDELRELTEVYSPEEMIFCTKDIEVKKVIQWMGLLGNTIHYKTLPELGESLIGSNSKNTSGDLYARDLNLKLAQSPAKRDKRILDIIVAIILLVFLPYIYVRSKKQLGVLSIVNVLIGNKTWVGFYENTDQVYLPNDKKGIFRPILDQHKQVNAVTQTQLNLLYAKNYSIEEDIKIISKYLFG